MFVIRHYFFLVFVTRVKVNMKKDLKNKNQLRYLKFLSQEFRLKNIDEKRNYFLEEIKQIELMSRKHKKIYATLTYIEDFLISASAITKCMPISTFDSLIGVPIGITSSAIELKTCAIAVGIKKYESNIRKKR